MKDTVYEYAPVKLNLFLHILSRRGDEYHNLQSLSVFCDVYDRLSISPADTFSFSCSGEFSKQLPETEKNICLRAYRLFKERGLIISPVHIELEKNIPLIAGLGGGSSDAAATLRGLTRYFDVQISREALHDIALELGADVPICLEHAPCYFEGIGDVIHPAKVPKLYFVLINPVKACPTAQIFEAFKGNYHAPIELPHDLSDKQAFATFLDQTDNQLTDAARADVPEISALLDSLSRAAGCESARMSGSGATCFGLFFDHEAAKDTAAHMKEIYPDYWVRVAQTI